MRSLILLLIFSTWAEANSGNSNCYSISQDNPQRSPQTLSKLGNTWCYLTLGHDSSKRYVFQFDENRNPKVVPELSAIVDLDEQGNPTGVLHGVLDHGKLTYHHVNGDFNDPEHFNPLPVPLSPPTDAPKMEFNELLNVLPDRDVARVYETLQISHPKDSNLTLHEGTFEFHVPTQAQPFKGYWWPFENLELAAGDFSPLGKYDLYIQARDGKNPNSVGWEKQNHSLEDVKWGGHCNGWAASSLLYPEPTTYRWDAKTKKVFSPTDQKGILTEASYCVKMAFYGHRYWNSHDDIKDIYPDLFHQVLTYYIRDLQKSVAMDYIPGVSVDNHVISGYKTVITPSGSHQFDVKTDLTMHGYELTRNDDTGIEKAYIRSYHYTLTTDAQNNITGGSWNSENPDFMWVPLSQDNCEGENPNVDPNKVLEIIQSLPVVKTQSVNVGFDLNRALGAGEEVNIPISTLSGMRFRFAIGDNDLATGTFLNKNIVLIVTGHPKYPDKNASGLITQEISVSNIANAGVWFEGQDLVSVHLKNKSWNSTKNHTFKLTQISYSAGD